LKPNFQSIHLNNGQAWALPLAEAFTGPLRPANNMTSNTGVCYATEKSISIEPLAHVVRDARKHH